MFKMRFGTALALLTAVVSPLLLECTTTTICQMGNPNDYVEGQCPVKMTSVPSQAPGDPYTTCVSVHVWISADDLRKSPKIEILSPVKKTLKPTLRNVNTKKKCETRRDKCQVSCDTNLVQQLPHSKNTSSGLWKLVHDCVTATDQTTVNVSYSTKSKSCSVAYTVSDPIRHFELSVNQANKSITVTVGTTDRVYTRWCYQKNSMDCLGGPESPQIPIDPSRSRSAVLKVPYMLPCLCVQVYYTYTDAARYKECPFQNKRLIDIRDVWSSYNLTLYQSKLKWSSECPASDLNISASLCWKQSEHLCVPVLDVLEKKDGQSLTFNTSAVDKHPQMCLQFSLEGSSSIACPFQAGMSSWNVYIGPGVQSISVYLTSSAPAKFSAQLCALSERGCSPIGLAHSVTVEENAIERSINVPLPSLAERPCVKVWQSDPALHGRRILCPDYTHKRRGLYATAALIFVVVVASLVIFIQRVTKSGATGGLYVQKPLLLVCSSDQSAHVSAVCAFASILKGELGATVHTALWAQTSQSQGGTAVADLGPLPWLYGRWEAVRRAQGKMLIMWSPEAKKTYESWKEERSSKDKRNKEEYRKADAEREKIRAEVDEDLKRNGRRLGKSKKEKAARKKDLVKLCNDQDSYPEKEPSTVIQPVFMAALACLEGALHGDKGQGVAIVYFQGLGHDRDIPKDFRGVPRYCLPQEFRGLIQELGELRRHSGKAGWPCWPRLLSKVLSIWLARRLAQRLQTLLPQTQGRKMPRTRVAPSTEMTSDKTKSRLKLPLAAGPETVQELRHGSLCSSEKL
ncbi:LOW QUALITY PROTEIN: uncharacterized protein LOC124998929 [Mugil cephalus]|uniref:LOW QUALITY PROTEIN: uncharacterized protein LOC124998929 n=1 Tax=Mugil cephalus TaxID=48193 RepID=UPI001FB678AA|nr:LOW QUALITY PROTEIN: uncharacterized protein LOC124998929 [Mugil cephalus]